MIPVTAPLGRSERRVAAACYVQGLLMPGQRTVPSVSIAAAGSLQGRPACQQPTGKVATAAAWFSTDQGMCYLLNRRYFCHRLEPR
jgi:hypothetical protein